MKNTNSESPWDEQTMQEQLGIILDEAQAAGQFPMRQFGSFEDYGVLTNNKGLVLKMMDGSEYQITIVRSR